MWRSAVFCLALVLVAACGAASFEERASAEPTATSTRLVTRTPVPTATQTPTPTATAPAAVISGDLREPLLSDPVRQSGAPCGFVDVLDFPLDAPHGESASGGGDFGRFRDRYDGFHTGEDWRDGASSFGKPVYSIGHGQVTYAQPNGWGADKGVVIVQHTFRDGRRILSLYGHLDPPSVDLRAGQCAERGDIVGAIGDPRSPPHLHFEIRVHLPETPGPGYWSVDPSRAGWRPPSATIWNERVAALPGVRWTHLSDSAPLNLLGTVDGKVLFSSDAGEVTALDIDNGRTRWTYRLSETANNVILDSHGVLIYVGTGGGVIDAFNLSDLEDANRGSEVDPVWSADVGQASIYELVPLPRGGLIAASRSSLQAISDSGGPLWSVESDSGITNWAQSEETLILLAGDEVWVVDERGASWVTGSINGRKVVASEQPFIYAEDGVYQIDEESGSVELLFGLPSGFPRSGDLSEMPEGGILVAHTDLDDKRLIAVDKDGLLRWERSIASLGARAVKLLTLNDEMYLMTQYDIGRTTGIDLFHVGTETGDLTRIFSGGTRSTSPDPAEIAAVGDSILINITGVGLAAIEPLTALEAVQGE